MTAGMWTEASVWSWLNCLGCTCFYRTLSKNCVKTAQILPELDQDAILLREIAVLHQFVREWIRRIVPRLLDLPEFRLVERADVLRFRTGEYKDFSEQIWMEDVSEKDAAVLKRWLEQKLPNVYMNSDFRGLNLSGGSYEDIDLRYSHCTGSDFSGSRLQRSVCIGTDFSGSNLSGADLSQSLLYDADFSGSDLRGARFTEAVGGERFIHEGMVLGFGGVRFNDANLEERACCMPIWAGLIFRAQI